MAKFTVHVWIAPLSELNKSDCAHETRTLAATPRLASIMSFVSSAHQLSATKDLLGILTIGGGG